MPPCVSEVAAAAVAALPRPNRVAGPAVVISLVMAVGSLDMARLVPMAVPKVLVAVGLVSLVAAEVIMAPRKGVSGTARPPTLADHASPVSLPDAGER